MDLYSKNVVVQIIMVFVLPPAPPVGLFNTTLLHQCACYSCIETFIIAVLQYVTVISLHG